jgi:hypothetical protein
VIGIVPHHPNTIDIKKDSSNQVFIVFLRNNDVTIGVTGDLDDEHCRCSNNKIIGNDVLYLDT